MWYLSCIDWEQTKDGFRHNYHLKMASSIDGIDWRRDGQVAIDFRYKDEYAISVPRVIREGKIYRMWYSYRGGPIGPNYAIGYAESPNGTDWKRKDEDLRLVPSARNDWDSEMICYPYIFNHSGKLHMLYNGNGYGKSGFGLAVLHD